MPKLLIFAPCENVLISSQGNSASLIVILHQLALQGDIPDPLPANAATQIKWFIFAQWEASEEEIGIRFEQKLELKDAQGTPVPAIQTVTQFVPEAGKPIHRMIANLTFFPLIPAGHYRLYISIKRADEENWHEAGDYPLQVIYQRTGVPVLQ